MRKIIVTVLTAFFMAGICLAAPGNSRITFSTTDLNGNEVTDAIFAKNKVTMLNVWGTFCGPCIREMPELAKLNKEYKDRGFEIVGIVIDVVNAKGEVSADLKAGADEIINATGADYLHIAPSKDMMTSLLRNIQYVPTTVFVDSEGNQIGDLVIGSMDKKKWQKVINSVLKEAGV